MFYRFLYPSNEIITTSFETYYEIHKFNNDYNMLPVFIFQIFPPYLSSPQ